MIKREKKKVFWAKLMTVVLLVSLAARYSCVPQRIEAAETATEISGEIPAESELSEEISAGEQPAEESSTDKTATGESPSEKNSTEEQSAEEASSEPSAEEPSTGEQSTEEPSQEQPETDPDEYTLIAHRGYSGYAPANSMPAFEKAVAAGFTNIELDLRRSKEDSDGNARWVISHDASLKNTMGVDKNISDLTYSQILQYSYTLGNGIESYKNLKIVTLEEIVDYIKKCKDEGLKITWQLEIKNTDEDGYSSYFEEEIIQPILDAGVQDTVMFTSFNASYLKKIKTIDSGFRTWYLSTILDEDAIEDAKNCQAEGISFKGTVNYTSEENIKAALAEGFRLGAYTINSPVIMGAYYQWGVRNFSTDALSPMDVSRSMLTGTYNINAFTITLSKVSYKYDGSRRLPKVKVTYKGEELVEGVNYALSYTNNKNPGTASVFVSGINNCTSEQKLTFQITMPKVSGFKIAASKASYVKLSWSKVSNVSGYIVYQYNYTTKKYEAVKKITNTSTVSCKIKKLTSATKYKFRVKAYAVSDGKTYKSAACAAKTTYTKPSKAKISSLTRYKSRKRLRIKWAAVPRCTGYNIKIATDKNMKNIVGSYTVKGSSSQKLKVKKLSKKKTYYVKVRAYLKVGNTVYNGAYSSVVKTKGKKK